MLLAMAVLSGFCCTWMMRKLALRTGTLNHPNPIVQDHRVAVPYLGGIGVLLGTVIPLFLLRPAGERVLVIVGFAAFSLLGLFDDLAPLNPLAKFSGQVLVAVVISALWMLGSTGLLRDIPRLSPVAIALGALWLLVNVNALNFVDVCDGVAASVAAVILLCWGLFATTFASAQYVAAGGACLGFLWWNKPPAKIYLGDCGAMGLGFLLGVAAIDGYASLPAGPFRLLAPILCTAVPLFELVFITVVRIRKGLPWWRGSPDHFALRLQRAGLRKSTIDLLAAGFSILFWFCGMTLPRLPMAAAAILCVFLLTGVALCWKLLLPWEP